MALSVSQTKALIKIIQPGMRIASFGYPDVIAPLEVIEELMGDVYPLLEARQDSEVICKRHGLTQRPIPDAHSLFKLLECELDVYDIVKERGCEILCDLNVPFPMDTLPNLIYAGYDIVLDVGTVEHCFNIGQAMQSMAGMVKPGGTIIHENPHLMANHGFYNLNPTFFHDFYKDNGFELIECCLASKDGHKINVPHTQRFKFIGAEINIFAMAKRVAIQPFVMPTQTKYRSANG